MGMSRRTGMHVATAILLGVFSSTCDGGGATGLSPSHSPSCGGFGPVTPLPEYATVPVQVASAERFTELSMQLGEACAVTVAGAIFCWGTGRPTPTRMTADGLFQDVSVTDRARCGLAKDGRAMCWGDDLGGFLATEVPPDADWVIATPSRVIGTDSLVAIRVGGAYGSLFACGLESDGRVRCWGKESSGRIGADTVRGPGVYLTPHEVAGGGRYRALSLGREFACAVTVAGALHCWGANGSGQLGDGTTVTRMGPTPVASTATFAAVATGAVAFTCALDAGGNAYCWGDNAQGQLGDATVQPHAAPAAAAQGTRFRRIAAGETHVCGLRADSTAFCWGANLLGQLGRGSIGPWGLAGAVSGDRRFSRIAVTSGNSCALAADGVAWCWGAKGGGLLGTGP